MFTQQAEALKRHTDLKVGMYWGSIGVDSWDAPTWKQEVDKYEVLFPYFFLFFLAALECLVYYLLASLLAISCSLRFNTYTKLHLNLLCSVSIHIDLCVTPNVTSTVWRF